MAGVVSNADEADANDANNDPTLALGAWKTEKTPMDDGMVTNIFLPSSKETLFWSIHNTSIASIVSTRPKPQKELSTGKLLFPPNFVLLNKSFTCFNGAFTSNESNVGCYSADTGRITYIPKIYESIDPVYHDGLIWFRGKGHRGSPAQRTLSPFGGLHYIYSYDVNTQQLSIRGKATCSLRQVEPRQMREWCRIPAHTHGELSTTFHAYIDQWTNQAATCEALAEFTFGMVVLVATLVVGRKHLEPTVFVALVYIGALAAAELVFASLLSLSVDVSDCFLIPGFLLLLVGYGLYYFRHHERLRRFRSQQEDGETLDWPVVQWSWALLRVGAITYSYGWHEKGTNDIVPALLLWLLPLLFLYRATQLRVCLAMAVGAAVEIVAMAEASGFIIAVGVGVAVAGVVMVKRTWLRGGTLLYCIGLWGLISDIGSDLVESCILNLLLVVLPVTAVASFTNDSITCTLAILGLLYGLGTLCGRFFMMLEESLGSLLDFAATLLGLYLLVVLIVATAYTAFYGCAVAENPRNLSALWGHVWPRLQWLWSCCKCYCCRGSPQPRQRQATTTTDDESEQELPLVRRNNNNNNR